jgi:hypothetical protein
MGLKDYLMFKLKDGIRMTFLQYAVLSIAFLLELSALVAFTYWGFQLDRGWMMKILFGIGTPILVAIIWGTFIAPKASLPVSDLLRIVLQFILFGLAATALYYSNKGMLAVIFMFIVIINLSLMYIMKI